jgi:hypothetical protein
MMLASTFLMSQAFAARIPLRPLHSIACYLMAIAGAVMLATPWHFRDALHKAQECRRFSLGASIFTAVNALVFGIFAFIG